jgi:hypothetical protein
LDDFFIQDAKVGHSFEICERVGASGVVAEETKGVEEGDAVVDRVRTSLRIDGRKSRGESGCGEIARETGFVVVLRGFFVEVICVFGFAEERCDVAIDVDVDGETIDDVSSEFVGSWDGEEREGDFWDVHVFLFRSGQDVVHGDDAQTQGDDGDDDGEGEKRNF